MDKPGEHSRTTPRDFFLWAGAMLSLFASIVAFLALIFDYINYAFPDPLNYYSSDPYQNGASYEMASFIIFGALCLVLLRVIHRTIEKDPTRADIWVRRWALYFTLFVAGFAMAIDLIVLLTSFLNGDELGTRFLLKVLMVLMVSAVGFMHFWADLRGYWTQNPKLSVRVTWGVGILGILTIAAGFIILGTPQHARDLLLDQQKISDLETIQEQVVSYYQTKDVLPTNLGDLNDSLSYYTLPQDPQAGDTYDYQATGALTFNLCATFNLAGDAVGSPYEPQAIMPASPDISDNWQHAAGHVCFARTIDPARYPVTIPAKTPMQ